MRKALLFLLLATAVRADHFTASFTAGTSLTLGDVPFPPVDLTGAFDTDSQGGITALLVSVGQPDWYWVSEEPLGIQFSGGFATYESVSNSLDAQLMNWGSEILVIRPDGTWWTDFGGSLFETGVYSIIPDVIPLGAESGAESDATSVPEPAGWMLLAGAVGVMTWRRR